MDNNYNPDLNPETGFNTNTDSSTDADSSTGTDSSTNAELSAGTELNSSTDANTNTESDSGTAAASRYSSDSLYSYSYVNQKEQNQEAHDQAEQNRAEQNQAVQSQAVQQQEAPDRQYYTPYDTPERKKKSKEKKKNFGKTLAKCAAIALVCGLVGGSVFYGVGYAFDAAFGKNNSQDVLQQNTPTNNKVTTTSTATQAVVSDFSDMVEEVMPSIVSITSLSVQEIQTWFGQTYRQETPNAGSGIVVAQTDSQLYIVTNNHVVSGATTLSVTFVDDESVSAQIKGTDASTDLAVITVAIKDIPEETLNQIKVATLGDSGILRVGEPAIAIGNALGYGQSVTTGVISALDREVTVTDTNNNSVTNKLIQTDAAINPGNSGGALLNIKGEVIGINSVKYSDTDVEGMGYAIPISTAEPIINDLITREVVDESETGYLGIAGADVTDEISEYYNLPKGISVQQVVAGSAAEKAGIKKGDIIVAFDGREVLTMNALAERVKYYAAGTTVDVTIMRAQSGEYVEETISVTLGRKN